MATLPNGILGAISGRIGTVTGYKRQGKEILRISSSTVKDKATPKRTTQRQHLTVCTAFAGVFTGTGFLSKSFPAYGHGGSGYNRAISAWMSLAVTGEYPNTTLTYAQVLVSKGRLPSARDAAVAVIAPGVLQFSFTDNSADGIAAPDDNVILVAYAPLLKQAVFTLTGGLRKDGQASLDVSALQGYEVETWIGFLNRSETDASDSVYTGRLMIV